MTKPIGLGLCFCSKGMGGELSFEINWMCRRAHSTAGLVAESISVPS